MNLIRLLNFIATTSAIAKANAEGDDGSLLSTSGSGLIVKKKLEIKEKEKETSIFQSVFRSPKRMLEAAASRLLQIDVTIDLDYFDCCDDDEDDDENSPSPTSSMNPTTSPTYSQKKFFFSLGDAFAGVKSCSMTDDYVVIGLPYSGCKGEAYLFKLDGTEVKKLNPDDDSEESFDWFGDDYLDSFDFFGYSVSIDEKIVVEGHGYISVFSRDGIYERTIKCDDCTSFGIGSYLIGGSVATLGNLIVTSGEKNSIWKLFIFTTEGELLKELDYVGDHSVSVAMSEQYIVFTGNNVYGSSKTFVYSNEEPDFPLITEIERAEYMVAVAGDRLLLNNGYASAWLYSTNGTLIETLEIDTTGQNGLNFVDYAITDEYIIAGAPWFDDLGCESGAVFIYSAVTGEFIKKITAADGTAQDEFGHTVCTSNSHFVAVARPLRRHSHFSPFLRRSGEAYLFPLAS